MCRIGRAVRSSHGYSGLRIEKHVVGFKKLSRFEASEAAKQIYPDAEFMQQSSWIRSSHATNGLGGVWLVGTTVAIREFTGMVFQKRRILQDQSG